MKYKELIEKLQSLPKETLEQDATVWLSHTDEYIPVEGVTTENDQGVLESGHTIIYITF